MTATLYDFAAALDKRQRELDRAAINQKIDEDMERMLETATDEWMERMEIIPDDYDEFMAASGFLGMAIERLADNSALLPECLVDVHYDLERALADFLLALTEYWENQNGADT